jgi:hypothetical protein
VIAQLFRAGGQTYRQTDRHDEANIYFALFFERAQNGLQRYKQQESY